MILPRSGAAVAGRRLPALPMLPGMPANPQTAPDASSSAAAAAPAARESERIVLARLGAQQRYQRQRRQLRPVTWLLLVVVGICVWTSRRPPGFTGAALAVTLALVVYVVPLALAALDRWPAEAAGWRLALVLLVSASGVLLVGLEPSGALADVPVSAAVMVAFSWLTFRRALWVGGVTTVVFAVVLGLTASHPVESVTASVLLCVVLAVTAELMRRSRESQDRAELLLAELEDSREAETRAAAGAERARIARELHDVLAQSLSALSIQLEGARRLAERERVSPLLHQVITRSVELTREGLGEARQAVGALRGEGLPALADLEPLVERSRRDLELDIDFSVLGTPRGCEPQTGFALYRGVQEALTNVARYARGSATGVLLDYRADRVVVTVANSAGGGPPAGPSGGGGNGLRGMGERIERVGGTAEAGPADGGWRVVMEVPG